MSDNLDLSWLIGETTEGEEIQVIIPDGEGGFVNGSTTLWGCGMMWQLMVQESTGIDLKKMELPFDLVTEIPGYSKNYYWRYEHHEQAIAAQKRIVAQFPPQQLWRWEGNLESMKGWTYSKAPSEVFRGGLSYDCPIKTIAGKAKNFHELHMVLLPSMIQAAALAVGAISEPLYDYAAFAQAANQLPDKEPDLIGTAEQNERTDREYRERVHAAHVRFLGTDEDFTTGELWQARAAIWKALGEDNPYAYTIGQTGDYNTTSQILSGLLTFMYKNRTVWAKLARINDIKHDSVSKNTKKRRQIYLVLEIYKSEAEADASVADSPNGGGTPMPAAWASATPDQLVEYLKDYLVKHELLGKPWPVIEAALKKNTFTADSSITVEEAKPWIEAL